MSRPTSDLPQDLKAAHDLLRQRRIGDGFAALTAYFRSGGPTTSERQRLFTKAFANETRLDHIALQFAAALLEDEDAEGAGLLYAIAHPERARGANVFPLAVHSFMPGYCAERGDPFTFVPEYDLERFVTPSTKQVTGKAFVAGLPGGRVLGESFLPVSAEGHLFVERMVFNHGRTFEYDAGERLDGIAVPATSRFLVQTSSASKHGPAILLGHSGNFGHWFLNHLSRLALVGAMPELSTLPVVIGQSCSQLHLETLARCGFGPDRIIRIKRGEFAWFETLWVPSQLYCQIDGTLFAQWTPKLPPFVRQAVGVGDPPAGPRKLFLTRRSARQRRMLNEDELFTALEPMGFERIECGELSFTAQLELAAQAGAIVGPVGAAMVLTWFAPRGIPVVDFAYPGIHMQIQRQVSWTLGQTYAGVTGTIVGDGPNPMAHDFVVDVARAVQVIGDVLAR